MKCVYETSTGLDAHMILNLLELQGISGRVDGEYLQGGIGELQTMNFVRVLVPEEDCAEARKIIDSWELIQPASDNIEREDQPHAGFLHFIVGVMVGAGIMYWILKGTAPLFKS
jgi:Putative prokaryotic signal transducing protein